MIRILGVDPGSRVTGYGVITVEGNHHRYVASGCIRAGAGPLPERLGRIHAGLRELIETHRPDEVAVEKVFVYRSAESALKLGHARGAVMLYGGNGGTASSRICGAQGEASRDRFGPGR